MSKIDLQFMTSICIIGCIEKLIFSTLRFIYGFTNGLHPVFIFYFCFFGVLAAGACLLCIWGYYMRGLLYFNIILQVLILGGEIFYAFYSSRSIAEIAFAEGAFLDFWFAVPVISFYIWRLRAIRGYK